MYEKKAEILHPYYVILSRNTRFDDNRNPAPDDTLPWAVEKGYRAVA